MLETDELAPPVCRPLTEATANDIWLGLVNPVSEAAPTEDVGA